MDFFAQQAKVRRSSRWLVVLFVLAVLAVVAAVDRGAGGGPGCGQRDAGWRWAWIRAPWH